MSLVVWWHKDHKEGTKPLREVIHGEGLVLKSVPVGFAFLVECHCSCCSFFFLTAFYFGSHCLGEVLDAENKVLDVIILAVISE